MGRDSDIALLSASDLLMRYRRKSLSPVEVTEAVLARIDRHQDAVNAFSFVDRSGALAAAAASEARWAKGEPVGALDGVPTTVKDLLFARGWRVSFGSRTTEANSPCEFDAPVVARLREQGAVLIGLTTTPEFGWKAVTDSARLGVTCNPWNTRLTPGGSSGGAAAAAALGMGALHIGTDGGGSIRIPASFTGIFGLKPSFGRVPAFPLSPFGTVAHLGPMTRSVADAALMLNVLAMPDSRDWFALPYDGRDYRAGLEDGIAGLKVAYSPDLGFAELDLEVAARVREAVDRLADLGAIVEEIAPPFESPREIFDKHWYSGAANRLAGLTPEQRATVDPGMQEIAAEAETYALLDYMAAVAARGELGRQMRQFHDEVDLLVTPAVAIPAFDAGLEVPDPSRQRRWLDWAAFSYPFNLTQQPACSIPCGFTGAGLPVGLQIVGPQHRDDLVLRAARAFESVCPIVLPEAPR